MSGVERDLADYFLDAINNDYLITVLITSHTQGKIKSQNLPFGVGKTTLAWWLNYYMNGRDWELVFQRSVYNPYDLVRLLKPGTERKNAATWDDVQATAPAESGVPRALRRLANFLTTQRPEVACLIMTAPNINSISSPLRKLVLFEVIVAERGKYEVQKIVYHKNFKRPLEDIGRLEYLHEGEFRPLPEDVLKRYQEWRVKEKLKLYPALETEMYSYVKMREWEKAEKGEAIQVEAPVVRATGDRYGILLPKEIGEKLHRKKAVVTIQR